MPAAPAPDPTPDVPASWWSEDATRLLAALGSTAAGLPAGEAAARLQRGGPNVVLPGDETGAVALLWQQFANPLVLILVVGAGLSMLLRDWVDALTILAIVAGSAGLGFAQAWRASQAIAALRSRLALNAHVLRGGRPVTVPAQALVPGDVVALAAGALVPADGVLLEARDFLVNQAALSGESLPVEKRPGVVAAAAPLAARHNAVFLGSSVRSGTARVLLVRTGRDTVLAEVAARIATRDGAAATTDFELGVRRFGELLMRVMLGVVVAVLVANQALGRPLVESLLFAVALAVGLSPELLPAIVSVSLARGARRLAAAGVLVRRLDAIEDLGGMNVLCTDKTGTLTRGTMALERAIDAAGRPSAEALRLAHLNAAFETGIDNPIDAALVEAGREAGLSVEGWRKVDEIPYDFVRRRLTIVVEDAGAPGRHLLVTKGAVAAVLAVCALEPATRARLQQQADALGSQGLRVLAVATRSVPAPGPAQPGRYGVADEQGLACAGFVCFSDPVRPDAAATLHALRARGVRVKMVSGDNRQVCAQVAAQVGLDARTLLTGAQIAALRDEALWHLAVHCDCFAEVEPAQKERIVRALQRTGHAVGYLGDGINDAPALHAADVGVSVEGAADVARESADLVLLCADLSVLERGIAEGRRTFANTLKYIRITTSANFGNMASMALAVPLLPFLPLTATQILLNNFLSDLPALALSADRVDAGALRRPQRWRLAEVRRFMVIFGLLSSVFDLLTFWLLQRGFAAEPALFHSAWFVVSLLTELAALLLLRTAGAAWRSRPSPLLLRATGAVALLALWLPYSGSPARLLGFTPIPPGMLAALLGLVLACAAATEAAKHLLVRRRRA